MPSKSFNVGNPTRSNVPEGTLLAGTLVTHATTPTIRYGKGFEVAKNGTGVYRVTWNRSYGTLIAAPAMLHKPAGEAVFLAAPIYTAGNNYVEFRVENSSGTATNAAATDEISFMLMLQLSGLPT